jgi:hypothetical protein
VPSLLLTLLLTRILHTPPAQVAIIAIGELVAIWILWRANFDFREREELAGLFSHVFPYSSRPGGNRA